MCLDDGFADQQPQPGALGAPSLSRQALKLAEQGLEALAGDTLAIVLHTHPGVVALGAKPHLDSTALGGVLDRVGE